MIIGSFAVLLPVCSVGVMGDQRTYAYPVVLRIVTSEDAITATGVVPYAILIKPFITELYMKSKMSTV